MLSPQQFFWRPRGVVSSLGEYKIGPLTAIDPQKLPRQDSNTPLFVAELPGGKVIGNTLLAVTSDDQVLGGVQGLTGCAEPEKHWLLHRRRFRFPRKTRGTALLLAMNGDNYFHWCFESVPRLKLAQLAGLDLSRIDWVVLSEGAPKFQEEMLQMLGIRPEKFMRCSKWNVLQFDKLIVPSMPLSLSGFVPEWMRNFLREIFLPAQSEPPTAKLYISRRSTNRRRLANEAELEQRLRHDHGFRICAPETLTFQEQAATFASARIVVAPHGAGLANLIFATPGGQLIELFHPEHPNLCYERLAKVAGFGYRSIIGRSTRPQPTPDDRKAEFVIEIDEVIRALKTAEQKAFETVRQRA